jgi:abortive infection bacteriophage resistance protein
MFIEIDKKTFNQYVQKDPAVSYRIYKPFSLFWQLTGDINQVAQTNKNMTELTEQRERVLGLELFLKEDWTQYYKEKP